jgi:hypothetical protein
MAKGTYKPAAMLDPLKNLREATVEIAFSDTITAKPQTSIMEEVAAVTVPQMPESPPVPVTEVRQQSVAPVKPLTANIRTSRTTIYLYPEDVTKLRKITAYVTGTHGIRVNESLIMRAALSMVEEDARLIHALIQGIQYDRRRKEQTIVNRQDTENNT